MEAEALQMITEISGTDDFFRKAQKLLYLKHEKGVRVKDLADALGMQSSYICHILRLNKLPDIVRDGYYTQTVSLSHLFIIARLKTPAEMITAYENVLQNNLTALETEALIRKMLYNVETSGEYVSQDRVEAAQQYLRTLGYPFNVSLTQTRVRGTIQIQVNGGLSETTPALDAVLQTLKKGSDDQ